VKSTQTFPSRLAHDVATERTRCQKELRHDTAVQWPVTEQITIASVQGGGFLVRAFKKTAYPVRGKFFVNMKITPAVFEAYLKCPTKCWLRATNEPSVGGTYSEWVKVQNDSYRFSGTRRLFAEFPNDEVVLSPDMKNFKDAKWRLAFSLTVQTQMDCCALQSELHALERVPAHGRDKPAQFAHNRLGKSPCRFSYLCWNLTKNGNSAECKASLLGLVAASLVLPH
jgi:hypothetical protein